jgi:hypothetical protein
MVQKGSFHKRSFHPGYGFAITGLMLFLGVLSACNLPQGENSIPQNVNVTQAYQTVEARLTDAFAQTAAINTSPAATDSGVITSTATQPPGSPTVTNLPEPTAVPGVCDQASPGIPIDVTIPDDTRMQPGQAFTKIWRLKNSGTCSWQPDYQVFLFSGEAMGAPASFALGQRVDPGQNVEISVDLIAPQSAGTHQGNWKLRNQSGIAFGIGPRGSSSFWVRIIVVELPTLTPTPATSTPTPTITPTEAVQFAGQVTIIPGETLDLDSNGLNLDSGSDLMYESTASGNHQLAPIGGVSLALFGEEQPSLVQCQSITLQIEPLQVDKYLGQFFCYRTDLGLPGQAQIDFLDPDTYSLRLRTLTWLLP